MPSSPAVLVVVLVLQLPSSLQTSWRSPFGDGGRQNNYGPSFGRDSGLGSPCQYDDDCYSMEHTYCRMQQSCECKIGFIPSLAEDRCLATIGAKCTTKYDCASLGSAGDCRQSVCDCASGYLPGPDNACLKGAMKLTDTCQEDIQCQNMNAICLNGKCQCPPGHHGASNTCAATRALHEPCDSDFQCYIGEGFKGIVQCYMGTCQCRDPYRSTFDGRCSGGDKTSVTIGLTIFGTLILLCFS